ncbi:MAG TPA: SCO family protein [Gaiellaceae bacterium]|nr:SCO family protein [Gaiellaceae bacterium]
MVLVAAALSAVFALPAAAATEPPFEGARIENPSRLPPFTLHDQTGRPFGLASARGKAVLVTFLYTHCRDVCPLTAQNLSAALSRLPRAERDQVRVLAVSVDPRGDTTASARRFVRRHRLVPQFHYLTGSERELAPVWRAYSVTSVARAKSDVDHTLYTVLADRHRVARVLYDATATPAAVAHDLRLLLAR